MVLIKPPNDASTTSRAPGESLPGKKGRHHSALRRTPSMEALGHRSRPGRIETRRLRASDPEACAVWLGDKRSSRAAAAAALNVPTVPVT